MDLENIVKDDSIGMDTTTEISDTSIQTEAVQIQRQDFTSEIFKIEINNLPRFGYSEIKKLLRVKFSLNPSKIKTPNNFNHVYVCFRSENERAEALDKINGFVWKKCTLTAAPASAVMDPMQKKREQNVNKIQIRKTVQEATVALATIPYENQLKMKEDELSKLLVQFGHNLIRTNHQLKEKIIDNQKCNSNLPCEWNGIKESPVITEYRNKSEFAVGKNSVGEKVVGYRLGSYADGSLEVGAIEDLPHLPARVKLAAKLFESFIQNSKYDIFSPEFYTGHYRQLAVRYSSVTDEIMLTFGIHTAIMSDNEKIEMKNDILKYFTELDGKELQVNSMYIEEMNKRETGQKINKYEHFFGKTHITEILLGLKFRISPASFFQINTKAAEVMYQLAIDFSGVTKDTTVLDICCGTGTIGLCFSKYCKDVFGVEIIEEAIKDAEFNATENSIENCKFYAGNSDDYISKLIHEAQNDNLLAIIDPPRGGLHTKSVIAIRNAKSIKRFVYMACSPEKAVRNWLDFARPCSKTTRGDPFVPIRAVAVDMFPHTPHMELLILFERIVKEKNIEKEPIDVENKTD